MFALFVDTQNIHVSVMSQFKSRLRYSDYVAKLEQKLGFGIPYKHAYGGKDYSVAGKFISMLRGLGFTTTFEDQAQWSVAIAIAAMNLTPNVTTVILGSNNVALIPLINYLKLKGINVIIAACSVPRSMRALAECVDITEDMVMRPNHESANPETAESLELSADGLREGI